MAHWGFYDLKIYGKYNYFEQAGIIQEKRLILCFVSNNAFIFSFEVIFFTFSVSEIKCKMAFL